MIAFEKCFTKSIYFHFWRPLLQHLTGVEGKRRVAAASDTNLPFICRVSGRTAQAFRQKVGVAEGGS